MAGDVGGNGSVYWEFGHSNNQHFTGKDPIAINEMKKGTGPLASAAAFRVTLRGIAGSLNIIANNPNLLIVEVPVVDRSSGFPGPPYEIHIDWQ